MTIDTFSAPFLLPFSPPLRTSRTCPVSALLPTHLSQQHASPSHRSVRHAPSLSVKTAIHSPPHLGGRTYRQASCPRPIDPISTKPMSTRFWQSIVRKNHGRRC